MPKEILTLYTKLLVNRGDADEELIDLLSTPDLGIGDPEKVEVTNLQDGTRRYVNGLKDVGDSLEFEFNYITDNYQVLKEIEESKQIYTYKVVLPDKLCFKFDAALSVKITGAAVGEQVKMTINLTPYSTIDVGPYDDNSGQQGRYSTFTIGQSRARSAGTLNLVNTSSGSIEELYINDVAQTLPTGVTDYETDDRPVITNYEVNPGDIIKIKGGFSLWETELPIEDVVVQNDLKSCRMMFYGCTGLTETPIIPEGVENCGFMFDGCTGLTQAPVIPSSARDCSMMFCYCSGLTEAPQIPEGVTECGSMFGGCTGLTQAPQIPEGVTNCVGMFDGCTGLTQAPVIPSSVIDCTAMFMECTSLTQAPVIPNSVTNCAMMFNGCSNLTTIPQENIDMMSNPPEGLIFEGCYNECPLVADQIPTSWGGNKVEEEPGLYTTFTVGQSGQLNIANNSSGSIKELYIDNVSQTLPTGTSFNQTSEYIVENGQKIKIKGSFSLNGTILSIKDIVLQNDLTSCFCMFYGCTSLTQAPIIPSSVTNCISMFNRCTSLTEAPIIPSSVTGCGEMFYGCTSLTQAPVIPSSVTNCMGMFNGCTSLTKAPSIPNSATNYNNMFNGCTGLTEAPIIPSTAINCTGMFNRCTSLTEAPVIPSSVTYCCEMFSECTSLTVAPVIPSSVTDCMGMFNRCTSLTEAPVIPSSVTYCREMFSECTSLTVAPVIPSSVEDCDSMFSGCTNLTKLPQANVDLMNNPPEGLMYDYCYSNCEKIVDPIRYDEIPSGWR